VQNGLIERNANCPKSVVSSSASGIHLGNFVEKIDGDLMGDVVSINAG
jgi:hypothetical protein